MDDFPPPPKLSFKGDVAEWRQLFELYMEVKEATGKEEKTKVAMLLSAMALRRSNDTNNLNGPQVRTKINLILWSISLRMN